MLFRGGLVTRDRASFQGVSHTINRALLSWVTPGLRSVWDGYAGDRPEILVNIITFWYQTTVTCKWQWSYFCKYQGALGAHLSSLLCAETQAHVHPSACFVAPLGWQQGNWSQMYPNLNCCFTQSCALGTLPKVPISVNSLLCGSSQNVLSPLQSLLIPQANPFSLTPTCVSSLSTSVFPQHIPNQAVKSSSLSCMIASASAPFTSHCSRYSQWWFFSLMHQTDHIHQKNSLLRDKC